METLTLHDFVINLLTDQAALTAFKLNPEAVLVDAGLADITEADVQEVIPLVIDSVPISDLTGFVGADATVFGSVDGDMTGAIRQLQDVTQLAFSGQAHGSDGTIAATTVAGVSVNLGELSLTNTTLPVVNGAVADGLDLTLLNDPSGTLDVVDPVLGVTEPVLGVTDTVAGTGAPVVGTVDPILGTIDPILGTVDPILGAVDPVLGVTEPVVGGVHGTIDGTLGSVTGTGVNSLTDPVIGTVTNTVDPILPGVTDSVLPGQGDSIVSGLPVVGGTQAGQGQDDGGLLGILH